MDRLAATVLVLVIMLAGCNPAPSSGQPEQHSGVVHVVLVWLKEPGNAAHRQQIIDGSEKLRAIPGLLSLEAGEVLESDRPVVEDSYDVALLMRFPDVETMQAYLAHPDHVNTVKTDFVPIMDRYEVVDFSTQ